MKYVLLFVFSMVAVLHVRGQSQTVSGVVRETEGNTPLPGVSILLKGTTVGTFSDAAGRYAMDVPENATLVFSFIGYTTQEVVVGTQTSIDLSMQPNLELLSEVTVTALGIKREKKTLGYAVADEPPGIDCR
jgi:hypothetical protein